jgi:NitT/TauT family transport system permease protein
MSSKVRIIVLEIVLLAVVLGLWEGLVLSGLIDAFFFPAPLKIAERIYQWFASGMIYHHLAITLIEVILAYVIGTVLGIASGLWLALSPTSAQIMDPYIKAFNSIPRVILAPIFTLWFGLGILSKVALGVTLVYFIAFFNVYQGIKEVDPVVLANARVLGAGKRHLLQHVYLPSATTWILSSLRVSIGFAVIGAVVGEYLGSAAGIGYLISHAQGLFDTVGVFAGMVVLGIFVMVLDLVVSIAERRLLKWRPAKD